MRVTVVGAGFAGLTVAYELQKLGFEVVVHERHRHAGGLLGTMTRAYGLVETGANALLANAEVENLFGELGLEFAERKPERTKRFIYWDGITRWPLSPGATLKLLWRAGRLATGQKDLMPRREESIASWGRRFAGADFTERLLVPGLQGIYAGDPEKMSATLVLRAALGPKLARGRFKGSVAPRRGMIELIAALEAKVQVRYKSNYEMPDSLEGPLVIAGSPWAAAGILRPREPDLAARLDRAEPLPLVSVTCFFDRKLTDPRGFGCLFPRPQGFSALGVLFNDCIFDQRSSVRSETWIFGGAGGGDIAAEDDAQILARLEADRRRLSASNEAPLDFVITRWPRAIPHYSLTWERTLLELDPKPPLYLHGNYLGDLGLARLYSRSRRLAQLIKENHG